MNKTKNLEMVMTEQSSNSFSGDINQLTGNRSTRKPTAKELAAWEEREAAQKREYLQQQHNERIQRLVAGLAMLEGPVTAALLNFGSLINEQMNAQGFWESDNDGEKIALMHSELSEGLEAVRKDLASDHIEGFSGIEEELADTVIRIVDYAIQKDLRLGEALFAKMRFNLTRSFKHGKAF